VKNWPILVTNKGEADKNQMLNAIEVINVSKSFATSRLPWQKKKVTVALRNVNLEAKEGECFALLGPNGAGKTTLIKILCSLIVPDKGDVKIAGYNLKSHEELAKSQIGLVTGEERSFYWRLTGRQNLQFFASFYNIPSQLAKTRISELAELLNIAEHLDKRFQEYSTGIKQMMAVTRGLLNDPSVLLIDEPTKSLDPNMAQNLRTFIKDELVAKDRKTVFFATHQIPEAESISNRIAIMDKGNIKSCGTLEELRRHSRSSGDSLYEIFAKLTNGNVKGT